MPRVKQARKPRTKLGESRDSIKNVWGTRKPFSGSGEWPERVDQNLTDEPDKWVQSTCILCSTGCAVDIAVKDGVSI